MRAFVTGASGFIGAELVRQLRARGDEVVAVIRHSSRGDRLREVGCELVEGNLASLPLPALEEGIRGCDAVFHLAGSYRIGIRRSEHAAMYAANVVATQRVLDAAMAVGAARIVYVSTANVYGDTARRAVDEAYRSPMTSLTPWGRPTTGTRARTRAMRRRDRRQGCQPPAPSKLRDPALYSPPNALTRE